MVTTARCDMVTWNAKRTDGADLHEKNTVRLSHNRMTCHLVMCAHQIFLLYQHFTVVLPLFGGMRQGRLRGQQSSRLEGELFKLLASTLILAE